MFESAKYNDLVRQVRHVTKSRVVAVGVGERVFVATSERDRCKPLGIKEQAKTHALKILAETPEASGWIWQIRQKQDTVTHEHL